MVKIVCKRTKTFKDESEDHRKLSKRLRSGIITHNFQLETSAIKPVHQEEPIIIITKVVDPNPIFYSHQQVQGAPKKSDFHQNKHQ